MSRSRQRLGCGAEVLSDGVRFRLYAPALKSAAVTLDDGRCMPMTSADGGFFELHVEGLGAGALYRYEIAPGEHVPDPASRFQPHDVSGPSEAIDPSAYDWGDDDWRGRPWSEAVVYELHVGCFGESSDFKGVERHLDHLERLGITAIELMPIADFEGMRNWGYDGVLPYAPDHSYGRPETLKKLVDACHQRGFMVLLDVVYNHFGPSGNYLARYAPDFFHPERHTPWGAALAFDNPVLRRFFIDNALYWIGEYRFDGLRLDAVHAIEEAPGGRHFLDELAVRVREATPDREVHLVLENDRNEAHWLPRTMYPHRYSVQWNDDFHHAAHAFITGERDGYYVDYAETAVRHLARALAEGFSYQGERSVFRDGRVRGEPSAAVWPAAFENFLQNHDQIGNRAFGERITHLVPTGRLRVLYALLFLSPAVPLVFMGEEWAASTPFLYFCDFHGELGDAVQAGRRREFNRFAKFNDETVRRDIPDPLAPDTFYRSRLDWGEVGEPVHAEWQDFVSGLIACRQRELVPRLEGIASGTWRVLGETAFAVEWPLADGTRWCIEANPGDAAVRAQAPRGRRVYTQAAEDDGILPPDSIRVTQYE
ncbi:MAG: malto-oligosyltrehalose trehalohydrolase [Gammaproteobacteria bacterium]